LLLLLLHGWGWWSGSDRLLCWLCGTGKWSPHVHDPYADTMALALPLQSPRAGIFEAIVLFIRFVLILLPIIIVLLLPQSLCL
jgi:hypothetical protein